MRRSLLFLSIIFCLHNCYAQDSVKKKNRLTPTITETFYVLKNNKEIKDGLYQALYRRNTPLASGRYTNNEKTGIWHFYDTNGGLIQNFDYDRGLLLYEKPDDVSSEVEIRYGFDDKITDSDRVTKPMKPGGRYYGYIPYMNVFKLSDDYANTDLRLFVAVMELLVSPGGRLADFKVHITSEDSNRVTTFSPDIFGKEDKLFVPATINNKPVLSRIFIRCRITDEGELDVL